MNGNTPLVYSLKNDKAIEQAVVTFNLSHVDDESDMTVGGEDPSLRASE